MEVTFIRQHPPHQSPAPRRRRHASSMPSLRRCPPPLAIPPHQVLIACGGLTLAGAQAPAKAAPSPPSSAGPGRKHTERLVGGDEEGEGGSAGAVTAKADPARGPPAAVGPAGSRRHRLHRARGQLPAAAPPSRPRTPQPCRSKPVHLDVSGRYMVLVTQFYDKLQFALWGSSSLASNQMHRNCS